MRVPKGVWQRMYDKLYAKAIKAAGHKGRSHYFFSTAHIPLSGTKGRKKWKPKPNVIQLIHYLDVPCDKIPEGEDVMATCLAITSTSNGKQYDIGVHKIGECPHKEVGE